MPGTYYRLSGILCQVPYYRLSGILCQAPIIGCQASYAGTYYRLSGILCQVHYASFTGILCLIVRHPMILSGILWQIVRCPMTDSQAPYNRLSGTLWQIVRHPMTDSQAPYNRLSGTLCQIVRHPMQLYHNLHIKLLVYGIIIGVCEPEWTRFRWANEGNNQVNHKIRGVKCNFVIALLAITFIS